MSTLALAMEVQEELGQVYGDVEEIVIANS